MTTALDVISDALEKIGVYAPSEPINDADANRSLVVLNDMLTAWAEEYLFVYQLIQSQIPTVATKFTYTIGITPGANIVQLRPSRIATGPGAASASVNAATLTATTTAPTNYPIIQFASVAGVALGQSLRDVTNPGAIAPNAVVTDITGNAVTMSIGALGLGVQVNDVIVFGTPPQTVNVVSAVEWNNLVAVALASGTPDTLYYNPEYPLGILNLSPIPSAPGIVVFDAWAPLLSFTTLNLPDVTFAAGGEAAVKLNLAVILKNYFVDAVVPATVLGGAAQTRQQLRYTNITSRAMLRRGMPAQPAA